MNQVFLRYALGVGVGLAVVKIFKNPIRKLAVATTAKAMNASDMVVDKASNLKREWDKLLEEAHMEKEKKKMFINNTIDRGKKEVVTYMQKTADFMNDLADIVENNKAETKKLEIDADDED